MSSPLTLHSSPRLNCLGLHTTNAARALLIIAERENKLQEERGQPHNIMIAKGHK